MLSELVTSNLKASAAAPLGGNSLCGLIGGVSIKVGYDDVPAIGGCEPGQASADPTTRSGDQHYPFLHGADSPC